MTYPCVAIEKSSREATSFITSEISAGISILIFAAMTEKTLQIGPYSFAARKSASLAHNRDNGLPAIFFLSESDITALGLRSNEATKRLQRLRSRRLFVDERLSF